MGEARGSPFLIPPLEGRKKYKLNERKVANSRPGPSPIRAWLQTLFFFFLQASFVSVELLLCLA